MSTAHTAALDLRTRLGAVLQHLDRLLPGQAPIREFVHHNTLHGYEHLPFPEAVAEARRRTGAAGYLPAARFRELLRQGRIDPAELRRSLDAEAALRPDEVLFATDSGPVARRDVYLSALLHPLPGITACQLNWQVEECDALATFQEDVPAAARQRLLAAAAAPEPVAIADLWSACLQVLGLEYFLLHPEDLLDLSPERAESMLAGLPDAGEPSPAQTLSQFRVRQVARRKLEDLLQRVGTDLTLGGLLRQLTGEDIRQQLGPHLIRQLGDHLDLGVAGWHADRRPGGFYAAWRRHGTALPTLLLEGLYPWRQHLDELPDDPLEAIILELRRMDLPEERWPGYLECLALELPGWSGMLSWRQRHPGYRHQQTAPALLDYLAVRLVLERLFALRLCAAQWGIEPGLDLLRGHFLRDPSEFLVRHALFNEHLPEYLSNRARRLLQRGEAWRSDALQPHWRHMAHLIWTWQQSPVADRDGHGALRSVWPLFRLLQHLGVCGRELRQLEPAQVTAVFDTLARLDDAAAGMVWLRAYEAHYRDRLCNALLANHGRGHWQERLRRPAAQLVCCMDEREEGLRRHLEEVAPRIETLGAAAHFGVANYWCGIDDTEPRALAPVNAVPTHQIHERARPGTGDDLSRHRRRRGLRLWLRDALHQETRRNLLGSTILIAAAAPFAVLALASKVLAPRTFGRWARRWQQVYDTAAPTEVAITAAANGNHHPDGAATQGFTTAEQAERVGQALRSMGLTHGFAPVVAILGHGSHSDNNPHLAAYACGACSGNHSGPNARIFAAMANRPEVRERLRADAIDIPDDCWFVAAEHDTCSEEITWYDLEATPPDCAAALTALREALQEAAARHAQERCRRLFDAPADPDPAQALRHVAARSLDFSQTRPELGHATNACALIGRRCISRGLFLDRRAFLISYDPRLDPEGESLEVLLLANAPVAAGINLEYYFSSVDEERYGAGSKVTHNLVGAFGLMDGVASDLRTGLPRQMTEIHEPMRLLVVVEARIDVLGAIYHRQPLLQRLVGNGWLTLAAKDPDGAAIHLFRPDLGWQRWEGPVRPLPTVACSADHYRGATGPLAPALIGQTDFPDAG